MTEVAIVAKPRRPHYATALAPSPRLQLRAALQAETAENLESEKVKALARQVAKAAKDIECAKAALAGFDGLDEAIREARVRSLKSGSTATLSPDLVERRIEREAAIDQVEQATAVYDLLKAELDLAMANRGNIPLAEMVQTALADVISLEVDGIIARLEGFKTQRHRLRYLLKGLELRRIPADAAMKLQAKIDKAIQDPDLVRPTSHALAGAMRYWNEFEDALRKNPDAQIGEPPALEQMFA
jgi:hypothetical protein